MNRLMPETTFLGMGKGVGQNELNYIRKLEKP
jgi:hypothetical protein